MTMKRLLLIAAMLVAMVTSGPPVRADAQSATSVTGAGSGIWPPGVTFNGLPLSGSTFGHGVVIAADGSAIGDFQTVLAATSLLGNSQSISIEGKVETGALNADGSVTFGGSALLDLGDGSPAMPGVPFSVTATTQGLQLVIGATTLPVQVLDAGGMTIQ